jgi:hypothetical protein
MSKINGSEEGDMDSIVSSNLGSETEGVVSDSAATESLIESDVLKSENVKAQDSSKQVFPAVITVNETSYATANIAGQNLVKFVSSEEVVRM